MGNERLPQNVDGLLQGCKKKGPVKETMYGTYLSPFVISIFRVSPCLLSSTSYLFFSSRVFVPGGIGTFPTFYSKAVSSVSERCNRLLSNVHGYTVYDETRQTVEMPLEIADIPPGEGSVWEG